MSLAPNKSTMHTHTVYDFFGDITIQGSVLRVEWLLCLVMKVVAPLDSVMQACIRVCIR